jgi:hypothetical protein
MGKTIEFEPGRGVSLTVTPASKKIKFEAPRREGVIGQSGNVNTA